MLEMALVGPASREVPVSMMAWQLSAQAMVSPLMVTLRVRCKELFHACTQVMCVIYMDVPQGIHSTLEKSEYNMACVGLT